VLLNRLALPLFCLLLTLVWAGTAPANNYLLGQSSGGQLQIGGGLPIPIQVTDVNLDGTPDWGASATMGITVGTIPNTPGTMGGGQDAKVFPPLLVPVAPGATVMDTAPGGALTIPPGVLFKPPTQRTVGQQLQNPTLYAVATNLGWKWPAATAMLGPRTMTVTAASGAITFGGATATTQYLATGLIKGGKIRYVNPGVASPFGGAAQFNVTPMIGSGIKTSEAVTVFAQGGPTAAPCGPCVAALLRAKLGGGQAVGGPAKTFVSTPGGNFAPPDLWVVAAGATPKGTILATFGPWTVASTHGLTNMASSTGFFWTTGRITVSAPNAKGTPENYVLIGNDGRTPGGAGTIQLVAGSLSDRNLSGPNANRGWIRLELTAPSGVPSISSWGLALLSGLMLGTAVVVGYRRSRCAEAA
jgi:hypothetical protein